MENVKKFGKNWAKMMVLALSLFSLSASAQPSLRAAFKSSYAAEAKGNYQAALSAMKSTLSNSYEVNLRIGWLQYMLAAYNESETAYKKAVDAMPYSIEAKLGYVYPLSALGKWTEVREQYTKILEICPQHSIANYRMGLIFYYNNDFKTAQKYFDKVVNMYPFDYDGVIMLGWTHLKLGKKAEATVLFNKALLIRPDDASANEGLKYVN